MLDATDLGFDGLVDLIRDRMGAADALHPDRIHSLRTDLVPDVQNVPERWFRDAVVGLRDQGHLADDASGVDGPAARLYAAGRRYWRWVQDDAA